MHVLFKKWPQISVCEFKQNDTAQRRQLKVTWISTSRKQRHVPYGSSSMTRWERFLPLHQCPVCFRVHSGIPVKLPTRVQNISKTCLIFSQTEGASRSRSPEGRQTSAEPLGGSGTQLHDAALSRCHCSLCSPALLQRTDLYHHPSICRWKGRKKVVSTEFKE